MSLKSLADMARQVAADHHIPLAEAQNLVYAAAERQRTRLLSGREAPPRPKVPPISTSQLARQLASRRGIPLEQAQNAVAKLAHPTGATPTLAPGPRYVHKDFAALVTVYRQSGMDQKTAHEKALFTLRGARR
jgi:hypothetical protein